MKCIRKIFSKLFNRHKEVKEDGPVSGGYMLRTPYERYMQPVYCIMTEEQLKEQLLKDKQKDNKNGSQEKNSI